MSGDVQPRKRKDKKRKKDDSIEQLPSQIQTSPTSNPSEDVNIHVHKDNGTGGGICAKIVFFLLFSALVVLIGLIITEHRGLTDLDTVDQESRFSQLFEGWTDNNLGHDDEAEHLANSLDDDEHVGDDIESQEHEEDEIDSQEHEEEEEEEEEEASEEVAQSEEEEEVSEEVPETEEDEEDEPNVDSEEPEDEDDDDDESELKDINEDDESEENEPQDNDDDDDEDETENVSQDVENSAEENQEDDDDDERVASEEEPKQDDSNEEEQQENEEQDQEPEKEEEIEEQAEGVNDQQNSKMVVKIGVGVALLVVAHVVLVRKWKSANTSVEIPKKEEILPDLSRRNTLVVPPTFQEVRQDIEEVVEEEDYSDEDGEVDSDEDKVHVKSAQLKYQELRTTYTRSLTPESEPDLENKPGEVEEEDYEEEEDEEDAEEEEDEDSEIEEDDEELLERLEAKYGNLKGSAQKANKVDDFDEQFSSWKRVNVRDDNEPEESESDKQSDVDAYEYENITNKDDFRIHEQIDEAHKNIRNNTAFAIKLFDALLQQFSSSPRSLYGKAQALDVMADQQRSNVMLQKAIQLYLQILDLEDVPDTLFVLAAERCINRLRFLGNYNGAVVVHHKLISRFPESATYRNDLVVSYLSSNRANEARTTLHETLAKHPDDGFALVHYGFVLKTVDNKLEESVSYLRRGISTRAPGVIDGRFYFHLGDALSRLGRANEAMEVYEDGVKHKLFLSKYQRSLYNVDRLKGQPWWSKSETPYSSLYLALEENWEKIRDEGLAVLSGGFISESENLKDKGDWKQFELFARGHKNVNNCKKCPITCRIIESVPDAKGCRRGQTKFSVMHPGTHVWPHCGPTNCRLRVHLGLKVPQNTYIRVADDIRSWQNGKVLIFDDSFEHEVWHNGSTFRLVLIVDVWHPELTPHEKRSLSPI